MTPPMTNVDLLVRHGYVITMDAERRIITDGAIAIVGRRIVEVGEDSELSQRYLAERTIDAGGAPVHPGLIECHMHASFQTYRGVIPDHIPEDEVFDAIELVVYNTVTDEEEYLGVLLASIEMVRNVTLGHANHLTDAETEVLIELGASLAWAPGASMMWGHGSTLHGRHAELWRRGANISLGSDSANWSNVFDLFRQANLALLTAREAHQDRNYLHAEDVLEMATLGGARACGMEDRIGSLEVGKRADIVIHTLRRTELLPVTDLLRNLMYSSGSKSVDTVIIDGKVILDRGEFAHFDEQALLAQVNTGSKTMLKRMGHQVARNQRPTPGSIRK